MTEQTKVERYEWAALAGRIKDDKSRGQYGWLAAGNQYFKGFDVDEDDLFINKALAEQHPNLMKAMALCTEKFGKGVEETKVGEFLEHVDYSEIPKELQELMEKYKDRKIGSLVGEKGEQSRVRIGIAVLSEYLMENNLYNGMVREQTKKGLERVVESSE